MYASSCFREQPFTFVYVLHERTLNRNPQALAAKKNRR